MQYVKTFPISRCIFKFKDPCTMKLLEKAGDIKKHKKIEFSKISQKSAHSGSSHWGSDTLIRKEFLVENLFLFQ